VALNAFVPDLVALETLRGLEPEMINLERDLVRGTRPGTPAERLLRVTVDVGHTLGARMVAKGVERRSQQELLGRAGCDFVEGYLVGWPVPAEEFPVDGAA
jgi:EAL domain-containing protein (putative c-di-GMP-specific phosphodiesterase class I)